METGLDEPAPATVGRDVWTPCTSDLPPGACPRLRQTCDAIHQRQRLRPRNAATQWQFCEISDSDVIHYKSGDIGLP
jgi:hypothetical protein